MVPTVGAIGLHTAASLIATLADIDTGEAMRRGA